MFKDNPSGIPLSTFVNQWVALYHDSHTDAHAFAVNLDVDRDHFISQADIAVIFMKYDVNGKPFLYLFDIVLLTDYLLLRSVA